MSRRMADPAFQEQQWADRFAPHIAPISKYVDEIREIGRAWAPYVAPIHGGTEARVLSIVRDPGPATQDGSGSGFLCTENDDGRAALQAELLDQAGLTPRDLLPWNASPWCINRKPKGSELDVGVETILLHLLNLATDVREVLFQGVDAQRAWRRILKRQPATADDRRLKIVPTFHPSPQALFVKDSIKRAERVARRGAVFEEVAKHLEAEA